MAIDHHFVFRDSTSPASSGATAHIRACGPSSKMNRDTLPKYSGKAGVHRNDLQVSEKEKGVTHDSYHRGSRGPHDHGSRRDM